jgi:hypothetical protein
MFANPFGAQISYGGAVTKISDKLDGVYNTVPHFGNLIPSAAKAIIFGKKCYILLIPIIDPITGQQVNKLFLWKDKYWWASSQDVPLIYIQAQEINSIITAWGTDGHKVYQLFAQPSTGFTKIAQSKLWDAPVGYQLTKAVSRLWMLMQYYSSLSPAITVSIDNESGVPNNTTYPIILTFLSWSNAFGTMVWSNAFGTMVWSTTGSANITVLGPSAVGQVGVLTGLTISTQAADMSIISSMIQPVIEQYRG